MRPVRAGRTTIAALTAAVAMTMVTPVAAHAKRGGDSHTLLYIGYYRFATGHGESYVEVRDAKTFKEVARFELTGEPNDITATPDGNFVYVAGARPGIQIIDTHAHTIINEVTVSGWENKIAFTAAGDRAYVAQGSSGAGGIRGRVYVDDVATDQVVASFSVGEWPQDIVITPDDAWAYVAATASRIAVVDLATNSVVNEVSVDGHGPILALSPDGSQLFVATNKSLTTIDVRINTVTDRLPLTGVLRGMALSPAGDRVYLNEVRMKRSLGMPDEDVVAVMSVIDTATFTKIGEFPEVAPGELTVSPDGTKVYISSTTKRTTTVLDAATGATVRTLVAPDGYRPTTAALVDVPND